MNIQKTLRAAWRSFWLLKKQHDAPLWARLLICTGMAIAVWLFIIAMGTLELLVFEFGGDRTLMWRAVASGLLICLSIAYCVFGLARAMEWLMSNATIEKISPARNWRGGLALNLIVIVGAMLGWTLSMGFIGFLHTEYDWGIFVSIPSAAASFMRFLVLIAAVNAIFWRLRLKRQALQHQATEAQLRLLQAQIEPHFLFNTLANVQSLMDNDPPRARQMLEVFTDYLRASLSQMRHADSTLEAELQMAQSYLQLLQIRMEERLTFSIEASPQARQAVVPTLLLQPLVENAIKHGLEPKVEGGRVQVRARVLQGHLEITVQDDGLGLDAPRRPGAAGRDGQGMALANIRSRLQTRYAGHADLSLSAQSVGTQAILNLPYNTTP